MLLFIVKVTRDAKIILVCENQLSVAQNQFFWLLFLFNNVMIVIISKCMNSVHKPASSDSRVWRNSPTLIVKPVVTSTAGVTWLWPPLQGQCFTAAVDRYELVPVTRWQIRLAWTTPRRVGYPTCNILIYCQATSAISCHFNLAWCYC